MGFDIGNMWFLMVFLPMIVIVYKALMALAIHSPELLDIVKKDIPEIVESCEEFVKLFNEVIDSGKTS